MEAVECRIADAMIKIMKHHMPEDSDTYIEGDMYWGAIWKEMHSKSQEILEAGVLPVKPILADHAVHDWAIGWRYFVDGQMRSPKETHDYLQSKGMSRDQLLEFAEDLRCASAYTPAV